MRQALASFVICLVPLPALAGDMPLSAEGFEAYVTGKTLSYASNGFPFGAEDYMGGRRVRWSYLDGDCLEGVWYPEGGLICFAYEALPEPQCWSFFLGPDGLFARFENRPGATELYEMAELPEPLVCPGPKVGV